MQDAARCSKCKVEKPLEEFNKNRTRANGRNACCRECTSAESSALREKNRIKAEAAEAERLRRLASDYESIGPANYKPVRAGTADVEAPRLKRQEFTQEMGNVKDVVRSIAEGNAEAAAHYTGSLAEDERRFLNRRTARSLSLSIARDELALQRFKAAARELLADKVVPVGYARTRDERPKKRAAVLLLSDLHIRADLGDDNPVKFGAVEESRRLAKVFLEACDYKIAHRADSRLICLLNGDLIEGMLLHDLRDGAPLTEQAIAFWYYMSRGIGMLAAAFPSVHVEFQPGNHGRNKLRHPGRATSSKWDGEETKLAVALSMMCGQLKNVTWGGCGFDHKMAISALPLPGEQWLAVTHGDTEVRVKHPDSGSNANFGELSRINATQSYGHRFDVFNFGHFHTPRIQYFDGFTAVFNGALVPPNGHARSEGYTTARCGQFIYEATEGYPVGDPRFLEVGKNTDTDARLNDVLPVFRY